MKPEKLFDRVKDIISAIPDVYIGEHAAANKSKLIMACSKTLTDIENEDISEKDACEKYIECITDHIDYLAKGYSMYGRLSEEDARKKKKKLIDYLVSNISKIF